MINLTRTLAVELAPHRIRVVSLCPVATDTPMLGEFIGVDQGVDGRPAARASWTRSPGAG